MTDGPALIRLSIGASLLLIGLAVPLIRGWIKPNHWYGFRIPLTLNDTEIWYPANRYAGWLLLIYGLGLLVISAGLPLVLGGYAEQASIGTYGLAVGAAMLVGLIPVVGLSLRYAKTLERERESKRHQVS